MKKITLIFLLTFTTITLSFSQTFSELIQLDSIAFSDVAFADVNGDNHQDFLITGQDVNYNLIAKLYINDGNGNFTVLNNTPFQGIVNGEIAFADVNGDNAVDVLFGGQIDTAQLSTKLYINDGNGNFTLVPNTLFTAINIGSIAFADVNGDNTQDVVISGQSDPFLGRTTELYTNDGNGNFTLVTGTPFSNVWQSSIAFADVNGDNTQDLLITGQSDSQFTAEIYTNDGNGNFTLMTGTPFDGVRYSSTAFADVNGDNAVDVLITGISANQQLTAKLYINDGNGNFTLAQGTPFDVVYLGEIAFADIDLDNDVDVLISGNGQFQNVANLYINDGNGNFTLVTGTPFDGIRDGAIAMKDINGDNKPEVLISGVDNFNARITKLYENMTLTNTNNLKAEKEFFIFPNPVENQLTIENGQGIMTIYNLLGQPLLQKINMQSSVLIDVSDLPNGQYFIHITKSNGQILVKQFYK